MAIFPVAADDIEQVDALFADSDGPSKTFLFSVLGQPTTRAWKWVVADEIVALAWFTVVVGESELLDIRVVNARRGAGFGSTLLRACLQQVFTQAHSCLLEVRRSNIGAQRLYRRLGFVETGIRPHYYPCTTGREDAILMSLTHGKTEQAD